MELELRFRLLSDATFGRGDGVAGLVDVEVEHDELGLPYLRGRTLKGLLVEECANLLFALAGHPAQERLAKAAQRLFGEPGSTLEADATMRVGPALLPHALREAIRAQSAPRDNSGETRAEVGAGRVEILGPRLGPAEVLDSLTAIRRQTAVDEDTGAPETGSLRAVRVILRETPFAARLEFAEAPGPDALALLAACTLALRRAGSGRNRGRGRLAAWLADDAGKDLTEGHFRRFAELVGGGAAVPGSAQ